jgi:response regulator RpfG family c-di-GMP phosphodiesterase/two-component sensor histidine kinase
VDLRDSAQALTGPRKLPDDPAICNVEIATLPFAAHELRTPLAAIIGVAEILRDSPLSADQRDMVDLLGRSARSLVETVNGVLDLAKLEAGKTELEMRPFSPVDCVEECIDLLAPAAAGKRLDLAYLVDESVPLRIRGDATRLRQVLVNLVGNALKFTAAGDVLLTVTCTARTDDRCELRFAVADSGPGIPTDRVTTIFDAYTQADVSTYRRYGGTGLGLAIVRHLVALMGGRLWVESVVGEGSSFQFTVPAEIVEAPRPGEGTLDGPLAGRRMLVVEDSTAVGELLGTAAGRWGVRARVVTNAGDAVEVLRDGDFDVAVIDEDLPGEGGRSLAAAIRSQPEFAHVPLVLMTSLNGRRRLEEGPTDRAGGGFAAYVTKPVKAARLFDALARACAHGATEVVPAETGRVAPSAGTPRAQRDSAHGAAVRRAQRDARTGGDDDGDSELRGLRVLVADDNAAVRDVLGRVMTQVGIEVLSVPDGEQTLDAVTRWNADLVLLDVLMPGVDGFEVCRRLKGDPKTMSLPVLMITGLNSRADLLRGADVGADGCLTKPFETARLLARVRSLARMKRATDRLDRGEAVLVAMARSIEGKYPSTQGHCERLSDYAARLARRIGLGGIEVDALRLAGLVHDIGKVAIPDAILFKQTSLDDAEWAIMRRHPEDGERFCAGMPSFRNALPIIRHHHERMDGTGYPDGLAGDAIPLTARVLQVVDIYDALTTERPYKPALSPDEAFAILETEADRGWRDPAIVSAFRHVVLEDPNATDGASALVN